MLTFFKILVGLILPILVAIVLFLINPILGILWTVWMVLAVIWSINKNLILNPIKKFINWIFRDK